ncbi:MAG: TIGR03986 family CRISPR-associated RAMP protein [Candidatus Aminicenantes bacterium]|nr:TIGR03986 family CRISPR-associated RAMP protein [Candidatus Aminicenantes bacterium]
MSNDKKNQVKYIPSRKEKFVNPYHFVSLEKNCTREAKKYREQKGNLTGWITCRMETLSPVFIPNTGSASEVDGKKHSDVFEKRVFKEKENKQVVINSYDFFSYTDLSKLKGEALKEYREPIIPGSEIRGMIRTAFEAVTNSCLSTIDNEQPLFKRVQTNGKAGRLIFEKGQWKIQPCERLGIAFKWTYGDKQDFSVKIKSLKEGQEVYIKRGDKYKTRKGFPAFTVVSAIKDAVDPYYEKGYFHRGEPFGKRKHHESVFVSTGAPDIPIDESSVKNYIESLRLYKNKNVNLHFKKNEKEHSGYKDIVIKDRELKDFDGSLIYFAKHNDHYYLCSAAIGREVFYNRLTDLIGDYAPCNQINNLCPACALFGIAGKESAASRVRFTDALVSDKRDKIEAYYHEVRILKELAGPKLSAAEFYLKKKPGNADLWNYDYAVNWRTHKYGIPGYIPEIRGRKFYWHHTDPDPYIAKDKEADPESVSDRNVAVRPLKENVFFQFKVYFNDITESELKRLLWILTIGAKKENAHKIGMGKPIGLGSVQVNVTEVNVRGISMTGDSVEYTVEDRLEQYKVFSEMTGKEVGCTGQVMEEYLFLTRLAHPFSGIIAYPSNVEEKENYKWFMANKMVKGTGPNPIIENSLPPLKDPELPKYELNPGK